jgi:hypothetical protein
VLPVSIFDGAIEGLRADISKLHKRITEERDEFSFRVLSQRAASLPVTDHRRMAFFAISSDSLSKSLFSGLPIRSTCYTQTQWSAAVALHFGIPIPALRAHIGKHIQAGMRRGGPFIVDDHGQSLLTAPALQGGHIQRNHNGICSNISDELREARYPHLGAGTHCSSKGISRNTLPLVTNETAIKNINGIIPDLVLQLGHLSRDENSLAGCDHLAGTKTLHASKQHSTGIQRTSASQYNKDKLKSNPITGSMLTNSMPNITSLVMRRCSSPS